MAAREDIFKDLSLLKDLLQGNIQKKTNNKTDVCECDVYFTSIGKYVNARPSPELLGANIFFSFVKCENRGNDHIPASIISVCLLLRSVLTNIELNDEFVKCFSAGNVSEYRIFKRDS